MNLPVGAFADEALCPIVKRPCWTFEYLKQELTSALGRRQVGSSTVHDQSSRTHAILELEIICQSLVDARLAVIDRQSELVPVGKRATDVVLEEQIKGVVAVPGGGWAPNPEYTVDQGRIDAVEAEKAHFCRFTYVCGINGRPVVVMQEYADAKSC